MPKYLIIEVCEYEVEAKNSRRAEAMVRDDQLGLRHGSEVDFCGVTGREVRRLDKPKKASKGGP